MSVRGPDPAPESAAAAPRSRACSHGLPDLADQRDLDGPMLPQPVRQIARTLARLARPLTDLWTVQDEPRPQKPRGPRWPY